MELIHTCYRIGEIDRSVAFYEALGFEERRRMPIRDEAINVFMGLPGDGDRLELTYNHGVDSYELGTGYNHIALTVDDLDGTLERSASRASTPRSRPTGCGRAARGSASCATRTATGSSLIRRPPHPPPRSAAAVAASVGGRRAPRLAVIDLRVELVPPRRLHLGRGTAATAGGGGRTRSTRRCASARA